MTSSNRVVWHHLIDFGLQKTQGWMSRPDMFVCVLEFAELDFAVPITDGSCLVSVWTSIVNLILQAYTMHVALRSRTNHFQNQHTSPTAWTSLATVFRFHILPNPQIEKKLTCSPRGRRVRPYSHRNYRRLTRCASSVSCSEGLCCEAQLCLCPPQLHCL